MTTLLVIDRLMELSRRCSDPALRAEFDAQIAYHASRVGQFTLAHELISKARSDLALVENPKGGIWIILAEGSLSYFERLDLCAADRFIRAHALSRSLGDRSLTALSAAWSSHFYFASSDYERMADFIMECHSNIDSNSDHAYSRMSLVLASSKLFLGDIVGSQIWFESARQVALNEGDRPTVGAILYNRAVLMLARRRISEALGLSAQIEIDAIRSAVSSAVNFQHHSRNLALNELLLICEARLARLEGRHEFAVRGFESLDGFSSGSLLGYKSCLLNVEYIDSLISLGNFARASEIFGGLDFKLMGLLEIDDRVVFLADVERVSRSLGLPNPVQDYSNIFNQSISACEDEFNRLKIALRRVPV